MRKVEPQQRAMEERQDILQVEVKDPKSNDEQEMKFTRDIGARLSNIEL